MAKYKVTLEGKAYEVEVECLEAPAAAPVAAAPAPAPAAAPAPAPAPAAAPAAGGVSVTAPLPGNILSIKVNPGDAVKAGQVVITLEAMKMETEVTAPQDGTVAQVLTSVGAVVETGATLMTLG